MSWVNRYPKMDSTNLPILIIITLNNNTRMANVRYLGIWVPIKKSEAFTNKEELLVKSHVSYPQNLTYLNKPSKGALTLSNKP